MASLFNTFYKVLFMLPPLLGLLLDCAEKTDQVVVSISLGALVHLIEVGEHQFSDDDWDTLLKSIRDASYTTQPLELPNSLGFENSTNQRVLTQNSDTDRGDSHNQWGGNSDRTSLSLETETSLKDSDAASTKDHHRETKFEANLEESEGLSAPSGRARKPAETANLQHSQTFGQRIMGNMMDNLLLRSFTSKPKSHMGEAFLPSSHVKISDEVENIPNDDEQYQLLETVKANA